MPAESFGTIFEPKPGLLRTDRAAWNCVLGCREALRIGTIPTPIPVDRWIEHPLGIRFGIMDLSHLGEEVLGAAFVRDREILISDRITHEGCFRFTCAHELAHLLLHRRHADVFHETLELPSLQATRLERQADRFAAAFLMPISLMERELVAVCQEEELDSDYCLTELMMPTIRSEWLWRAIFIPQIMRRFGVSKTAAIIRCRDLRLIDQPTREFMPIRFENVLREPATAPELAWMRIRDGRPVVCPPASRDQCRG
jgi:Zn-dependent peptidase ImmA (M78 family)